MNSNITYVIITYLPLIRVLKLCSINTEINTNIKPILNYAKDYVLQSGKFKFKEIMYPTNNELKQLTEYINIFIPRIKRGDTVSLISHDKRRFNDGTYIFDGRSVINLQNIPDVYGTLPKTFETSEDNSFHPRYFEYVINHNNFWWPSRKIRESCIKNIKPGYSKNMPIYYTTFHLHMQFYTLLFDSRIQNKDEFIALLNDYNMPFSYGYKKSTYFDRPLICSVYNSGPFLTYDDANYQGDDL